MKYLFVSFLVLFIISGCVLLGGALTGGEIFEGTGQGFRGLITVQVRMNGADITEIIIVDSEEDLLVGAQAIEELIDLVIMYNTVDIDAISGATESSRGFLEAVDNATMKR